MSVPPFPHDPSAQSGPASPYGQPAPANGPGAHDPAGWGQPAPATHPVGTGNPVPGQDLGSDLGAALKFAGSALLRNWVPFLVVGLIYSIVVSVIAIGGVFGGFLAMFSGLEDMAPTDEPPLSAFLLFYAVFLGAMLITVPFLLLWQAGSGRAGETILEGGRPSIGQALVGPMRIILTALLVGVITFIGVLLFYIPGLIAGVLLIFAIPAAVRGASPIAAIKESFALVKANLGTAIVTYLVISIIGSIAGMLVITIIALTPFLILFQIGMFERLNGRELPEPARA